MTARPGRAPPATGSACPAGASAARRALRSRRSSTFENIVQAYGSQRALDGVSLTVEPGEIVCLLGHSGCGKTTLLRIAAGVEAPTSGRVLMDGQEVERAAGLRGAGAARHRPDVPGLCPVPAHDDPAEHHVRPEGPVGRRGRGRRAPGPVPRRPRALRQRISRIPCPAASSSGWRWRAPSRRAPASCSWTSRSRTSTGACAMRSATRPSQSCGRPARRPSS